jgi:glucokinase
LQAGKPQAGAGNAALVAPGTGLGMSILFRTASGLQPSPSEGGHSDFAPRSEAEIDLLRALQRRYGRVSVERLLSGPGLANIYEHLRDSGLAPELPAIRERMQTEDPGSVIGRAGVSGECQLSVRALEMFCEILGATAGNLALIALAAGGVYLGGGIPPKIVSKLQEGGFLRAFLAKGRFSELLETFPVWVVLNDRTGLLGAARRAANLAAG